MGTKEFFLSRVALLFPLNKLFWCWAEVAPIKLMFLGYSVYWSTAILVTLVLWWASISCLLRSSSLVLGCDNPIFDDCSFLNSLTRSAYRNVLRVCSQHELAGDTLAIIVVLLLPDKESFKTWVSLLALKGRCFLSRSSALMHSFSASKDLLISPPSNLVYLF